MRQWVPKESIGDRDNKLHLATPDPASEATQCKKSEL